VSEPSKEKPFDYAALAKADATWLREAASSIKARLRNNVQTILETGDMLQKAKRRLGRQWTCWLTKEAQIPKRSAIRLLSVSRVFGTVHPEVLKRFTPTALYTLAEPGVPLTLREYVVEQMQDAIENNQNVVMTAGQVIELVAAYRDNPKAPKGLALKDDKVDVNPDDIWAADNWKLLKSLLSKDAAVQMTLPQGSVNPDATSNLEPQPITAVYIGPSLEADGKQVRRQVMGGNIEEVIVRLSGTAHTKVCPRCAREAGPKRLDEFDRVKSTADGLSRLCKDCVRKRGANERAKVKLPVVRLPDGCEVA
jgi:hypothetical protein